MQFCGRFVLEWYACLSVCLFVCLSVCHGIFNLGVRDIFVCGIYWMKPWNVDRTCQTFGPWVARISPSVNSQAAYLWKTTVKSVRKHLEDQSTHYVLNDATCFKDHGLKCSNFCTKSGPCGHRMWWVTKSHDPNSTHNINIDLLSAFRTNGPDSAFPMAH